MHPNFTDPLPYTFQLQVGRTGSNSSDDWTNVGLPITNTFFAIDSSKRVYGRFQWTHYRIKLTTTKGVYYSRPEPALGNLNRHDWRVAREIFRKESLMLRKFSGDEGYLLKRRLYGDVCPCVDVETDESRNPQDVTCFGTGYVGGYFEPVPCIYAQPSLQTNWTHVESDMRGTINDVTVSARMVALPQLNTFDVWVAKDSDLRWRIHSIQTLAEMRGVPLVQQVELRLIPFSDVIYQLAIDGQGS